MRESTLKKLSETRYAVTLEPAEMAILEMALQRVQSLQITWSADQYDNGFREGIEMACDEIRNLMGITK